MTRHCHRCGLPTGPIVIAALRPDGSTELACPPCGPSLARNPYLLGAQNMIARVQRGLPAYPMLRG